MIFKFIGVLWAEITLRNSKKSSKRPHEKIMKPKSTLHSFLLAAGSSLLAISSASAQAIFWDGAGGGTWGLTTNWSTDLVPTSSNDVTILGPLNVAGALTLNSAVSMNVNSINFTNTAATSVLSTSGGLTLNIGAGGLTTGTGLVTIGANAANGINTNVTAAQTWNVGAGGLILNNVNQGAFTITKTGTGTLTYNAGFANGSLGFEGGLTVNAGLVNLNFVNWSSTSVSLINSTATQTLGGGNLTFTGRNATASIQGLGAITTTGGSSTLSLVATGTGRMTVTAASFGYTAGNAVALVNGTNLGRDTATTTAVSRLILTSAPTLLGTTAAAATGINSAAKDTVIVSYLVGEATTTTGGLGTVSGTANTFLTYHSTTGLRPLNQTDEFTSNAYTSGHNTRITSATAATATAAINSLLVTSNAASAVSITNSSTLTVTSGAVLFTNNGATVTGTAGNILGFGGAQAQISTNSGVTATISAQISGSGGLNKSGAGTLILSGANSLSGGVSLAAGTLQLGGTGALNSTAGSENAVSFVANSPGTLALAGNSVTIANLSTNTTTPGTNFVQNANGSAVGDATLTVGNSTNASGTYANTIRDGTGGGTLALTKAGAGTLTLTGTNTYTGGTRIDIGTLTLGHATNTLADTGAVNVNGGALALGANSDTVGAVTLTSGSITGSTGVLTGSSYGVQSGSISAKLGGLGILTKSTGGIVTLTGANTYTGATNVDAGTLVVNGNISTSSLTTVAIGATLGGSGTVGKATINGTLAVGNSPGQMNFTDTLNLAGTTIMEIDGNLGAGVTGGHDFINLTGAGAAGVLTYGGTMTLDIGVLFGLGSYTWNLFDMASKTGAFTSITLADQYSGNLLDGDLNGVWDLTSGNNTWVFNESTGSLDLTVIPEPKAALLGAIGLLLILRRRRN